MALKMDAIGEKIGPLYKDYDWKDLVLYAVGVGAGFDDLEYCWEDKLKVIPSFSIASVFEFLATVGLSSNANLAGILHGEQDIIFHRPIPTEGKLTTEGAITNIYDKGEGRGATIVAEAETYHSDGKKLFTNIFTLFSRLDGGFDGEKSPKETFDFPDREPDFVQEDSPSGDQPLLYRLSGDVFQLHVSPEFAQMVGFEKPIMHGLCTHGYACRAVIKHLFPGQPDCMTRFKTRFSKTLYPGVPIRTEIWKIEDGVGYFRTINQETGQVVIDRGIVEWVTPEELEERTKKQGMIRFDDKVAIVTGAGAGLGKVYAMELAKLGAKVVVNDLGGSRDGSGGGTNAADEVVNEIKALGGEAVANYDSVATPEGGEGIVKTAVDAFGKVDVLINNAGILRDKSFAKMTADEWNPVMDVHLKGAYNVTRPVFKVMKENGYGRIIMTTSAAGLFGNFGQTNYSAAKLALVGFMNSLKIEGEKYDVKINAVAPVATTRLTEDVLPPDLQEKMKPEFVSPMTLYLCSDKCPVTGSIYNAGMGYYSRNAIVTGPGKVVGDGSTPPSLNQIAKEMDEIDSLDGAQEYSNLNMALSPMLEAFNKAKPAAAGGEEPKKAGLTVQAIFDAMSGKFQADNADGVDVVFQFTIDGKGGGDWNVTIKDKNCDVKDGVHQSPTTTILMGEQDFIGLMEGTLDAMAAYTGGQLKIEGDLMKSQLIGKLFKF